MLIEIGENLLILYRYMVDGLFIIAIVVIAMKGIAWFLTWLRRPY